MELLQALRALPGGAALLEAARPLEGVHLVGGAVRDMLRGEQPRELDVVVEGDPAALLDRLGDAVVHERFGTATVLAGDARIDVARARRETYPAPGVLPAVEPAPLAEDLLRRDFTVNAIALSLADGSLRAAPHAREDLDARLLRVLHERSFIDDPTRLMRLARYAVRLGFEVEPRTAELAAAGSLAGVSGARIGAELRLGLAEPDPLAVLARCVWLPLDVDATLARRALELLPPDGRPDLLVLASSMRKPLAPEWLDELEFSAREREIVVAALDAPRLAVAIAEAERPSQLHTALSREPPEAVALAGALGPAGPARRWLEELRHVRLEIDGDDLIAAGLAPGPELGRRLARTLASKLDGELRGGREEELANALAG
jgi:tRNA nucleotidyltransferase (CCA-adding enzyme)